MDNYWNEMPAPIDSYDLYAYGLRPARCNGCKLAQLRHELGDRFLMLQQGRWRIAFLMLWQGKWRSARLLLRQDRWHNVYELDVEPVFGQREPTEYKGCPIRYKAGFPSIAHSDECYNWQPPR